MRPMVSLGVLGYPGVSWGNQTDPFLEFNQFRDAEKVQFSQISQKLARTEI